MPFKWDRPLTFALPKPNFSISFDDDHGANSLQCSDVRVGSKCEELALSKVREHGLKHQQEKRSMDHFAGLDVSVKETSICIVG